MGKIKIRVDSVSEYREKLKHAEGLGLSVSEVWFGGAWESNDGEPIFLGGSSNDIEKAGYDYFHVPVSSRNGTQTVKVKPTRTSTQERGYVRITFTD